MCSTEGFEVIHTDLTPWQERVYTERYDLEHALQRLNNFMASEEYQALPTKDRTLLVQQVVVMERYYQILGERICNFAM